MGKYRTIGTDLNREYRNDLNHNFGQVSDDIDLANRDINRVETETKQTIDSIVGGGFLEGLENAKDNANTAAINANEKAGYANTQGNHAKTQGDYAKIQGDYAKSKGDYADEKAILANDAATNANLEATGLDAVKVAVVDATQGAITAKDNADTATTDARLAITDTELATSNANDATATAISSAGLADDAALNANTKADLAQSRINELDELDGNIAIAITNAETATTDAIVATDDAQVATLKANQSADNADDKAMIAQTAADNADVSALNADTKANLAQTSADNANVKIDEMVALMPNVEGLENKKAYDPAVNYVKNNIVRHNGSSYQALNDNIGIPVTDESTWSLVAQRGVDGEGAVASVDGVLPDPDGNVVTHENKPVLDALSDLDGKLKYKSEKLSIESEVTENLDGKVDKVVGKQLSTEDYTTAEKEKLAEVDLIFATKEEMGNESDARIAHENKQIHEGEIHGLRILDEEFQYFNGIEWVELKGGGGSGIKLGNVSDLTVKALAGLSIKVAWKDPLDVEIDGIPFAKWSGTQLRRKEGNYPLDEKDGTLIVDSKVRNQYAGGYSDGGLVNGTKYYYALFPYTETGDYTYDPSNRVEATALNKFIQSAPIKPTVTGILLNKATVTSDVGSKVSLNEVDWYDSPHEFIGLITGDSYTPYAKFEETATLYESAITTGDSFIATNKTEQVAPVAPSISNLKFDEATVTGESGTEVKLDDGPWFDSPKVFTGLIAETSYTAYARKKETSTEFVSDASVGKTFETPSALTIYGVAIDTSNSNPATAVTYNEAASGFTSEADFANVYPYNEIKPVMFKNGAEVYDIDPNDFTKKISGGAIGANGADGDIMIRFPKIWWYMKRVGTVQFVTFATGQATPEYKCLAHTKNGVEKDYSYIGAYLGFEESGKLRSIAGKTPTATKTIGQFRTLAQANGNGYQQMSYYQVLMMQVLYLVRYKNRDSQTAIGRGYVDGNASSTTTGGADKKGMVFGETSGKQQMKLFGVEDFWGNLLQFVDGMFNDASRNILIGDNNYNDTGAGYANYGQGSTTNLGGYIDDIQGGTETGFIIKGITGSETTHYADYGSLHSGSLPAFGGHWAHAGSAGAFHLQVYHSASSSVASYGARCCFI